MWQNGGLSTENIGTGLVAPRQYTEPPRRESHDLSDMKNLEPRDSMQIVPILLPLQEELPPCLHTRGIPSWISNIPCDIEK